MPVSLQILPTKNTFKYDRLLYRITELCRKKKIAAVKKKKIKIKVVLDNFSDRSVRMVNTYWKVVQNI